MANFCTLFENMDFNKRNKDEETDKKAVEAISNGLQLDEQFWRNFVMLTNNSDALGALLNVNTSKVSDWRNRIKKYLTKFYEEEQENTFDLQKKKKFVNSKDYKKFM